MGAETQAMVAGKQARNAMERVTALENVVPQIIGMLQNIQAQFSQSVEILDALVENFGIETVEKTVVANRRQKAIAKSTEETKQVAALIEQGVLKATTKVAEHNMLVFKETKPDGTPNEPVSRVQFMYEQLQEQFRTQLIGKAVGEKLASPGGNIFELAEIYEVVPQAAPVPDVAPVAERVVAEPTTTTVTPFVPEN